MYIHAIRLAALGRGSVGTPFELCTSPAMGVGAGAGVLCYRSGGHFVNVSCE